MKLIDFVKSIDEIAPVLSDAPDEMNRPKGDFMLVGCVVKVTEPTRERIHGKFKGALIKNRQIVYVNLVDKNGQTSTKMYRVVVFLKPCFNEAEKELFRIHDLIVFKNPHAPHGGLLRSLSLVCQNNYWLFRSEDQPDLEADQVYENTLSINQNVDEVILIEDNFLLEGGDSGNDSKKQKLNDGSKKDTLEFATGSKSSETDSGEQSANCNYVPPVSMNVLTFNKHIYKCIEPNLNENNVEIVRSNEESMACDDERFEPKSLVSHLDSSNIEVDIFSEASKSSLSESDKSIDDTIQTSPIFSELIKNLQKDKVLRLLLDNAIDFTSESCSRFYSYGQFSEDSISHMVSDRLVLGYCNDGCKMIFSYHKFGWVPSEDDCKHMAFCPTCGLKYILKVFFYCPLKLISDPHPIDFYFYSDNSRNTFGIDPVDYAYSDIVRGMFRVDVTLFLKGNDRFTGFDFHQVGNVLIPFFSEFLNQPFKKQLF